VSTAQEIKSLHASVTAVRCLRCGDDEVLALVEQGIDSLILDTASNITDEGFAHIAEMDNLVYLVVDDASSLSDASLKVLGATKHLSRLHLYEATGISSEGLRAVSRSTALQHVTICNASQVDETVIQDIKKTVSDLEIRIVDPPCPKYDPFG
jgi:hypothetical protein